MKFRHVAATLASALIVATCFSQGARPVANPVASVNQLIRAQQYDQALKQLRIELAKAPKNIRLLTLEGVVLSLQKNDSEALAAFDKALQIDPNYAPALKSEVQIYSKSADKRGIPLLKRILSQTPGDETAHEMLAVLDGKQSDCVAANENFALSGDALARHPGSLEVYGACLEQTGEFDKATAIFQQLVTLLPDRSYPKFDLAVVLVEAKRSGEAVNVLGQLLEASPNDPETLSLASDAHEAIGDTPKAVSLLRQAIVLDPTNASYYNSFAMICLDHESFQVGVDMISAGLKRIKNDPSLYLSRGLLYAQLAKYDEAEADFKTAETLDSAQSLSAYAIDLAELQKNSSAKALANVRAQLKLHPESANLHLLLAKLVSGQGLGSRAAKDTGSPEEAITAALGAIKLKPDMTEARDLLGTLYADSGQYGLAIEQCRLALRTNPNDQTAIYHLLTALRHAGKGAERDQIPMLVRQLAELQKKSRQQETDRKRFRLIETEPSL